MKIDRNEAAGVIAQFLSLTHDMGVFTDADVHNVWLFILENCELFALEPRRDLSLYFYPRHEVQPSLSNPCGDGRLLGYDTQIEIIDGNNVPKWRRIAPVGEKP